MIELKPVMSRPTICIRVQLTYPLSTYSNRISDKDSLFCCIWQPQILRSVLVIIVSYRWRSN